ncbi:MAG: DoxX family protein [Sulfuricaulis sp.]|uniref:DoxX family protein n=1 Tax=Sulfuricaulis sp. TaxID=2003553 RepID=UPI0034A30DA7
MEHLLDTWRPRILSIMRFVTGFLFMQHGGQKIFGFPAPQRHEFDLFSLTGIAGSLELIGGFLIVIGLFTRPTSFLLSGLMVFAYFIAHAPKGFWPILNGGELAALYSFVFLYLSVAGAGAWSIDRVRAGRRLSGNA